MTDMFLIILCRSGIASFDDPGNGKSILSISSSSIKTGFFWLSFNLLSIDILGTCAKKGSSKRRKSRGVSKGGFEWIWSAVMQMEQPFYFLFRTYFLPSHTMATLRSQTLMIGKSGSSVVSYQVCIHSRCEEANRIVNLTMVFDLGRGCAVPCLQERQISDT